MTVDQETLELLFERTAKPSGVLRNVFIKACREPDGSVSAETAIGAAAAVTGEWSLKAVIPKFYKDDTWVIAGDHINGLLFEDPSMITVWQMTGMQVCLGAGASKADMPDWRNVCARQASSLGRTFFPHLKVDPRHFPHNWSPEACPGFRKGIQLLVDKLYLTPYETALALGSATGEVIALSKDVVSPRIGLQLAADIMKGVSYMAPWDHFDQLSHEMSFDPNAPDPDTKINIRTSLCTKRTLGFALPSLLPKPQ